MLSLAKRSSKGMMRSILIIFSSSLASCKWFSTSWMGLVEPGDKFLMSWSAANVKVLGKVPYKLTVNFSTFILNKLTD